MMQSALIAHSSGPPSVAASSVHGESHLAAASSVDLMQSAVDLVSQLSEEPQPHSVASVDQHYAGSHVSGPPSVASSIVDHQHHVHQMSGPPSVAPCASALDHVQSLSAAMEHLSDPQSVASAAALSEVSGHNIFNCPPPGGQSPNLALPMQPALY